MSSFTISFLYFNIFQYNNYFAFYFEALMNTIIINISFSLSLWFYWIFCLQFFYFQLFRQRYFSQLKKWSSSRTVFHFGKKKNYFLINQDLLKQKINILKKMKNPINSMEQCSVELRIDKNTRRKQDTQDFRLENFPQWESENLV